MTKRKPPPPGGGFSVSAGRDMMPRRPSFPGAIIIMKTILFGITAAAALVLGSASGMAGKPDPGLLYGFSATKPVKPQKFTGKPDPALNYGLRAKKPIAGLAKRPPIAGTTKPTDPETPQNWIGGPKIGPGGEIIYW
jgi:hypothetical protein